MEANRRVAVWVDTRMADGLSRLEIPGTSEARLLRLLIHAALAEMENLALGEGALAIAPLVWAAVAQRKKRPSLIEKLPRLVDEYLEAVGAPLSTRAKTYALLLSLSPLQRLALLAEGARVTRESLGGARVQIPEEDDEVEDGEAAPAP